jgi:drug/metabolite transporter (DMT)-like permease
LLLIAAGIGCVNHEELTHLRADPNADLGRYAMGALLAVGAVVCWTWYPIRNADWMRAHPDRSPTAWATAQGLATLLPAAAGFALFWAWNAASGQAFAMPFGPTPMRFVGLMLSIGLLASWLGTLCWNAASQRLPTALTGQLIVFETLSALAYALAQRLVQHFHPVPHRRARCRFAGAGCSRCWPTDHLRARQRLARFAELAVAQLVDSSGCSTE